MRISLSAFFCFLLFSVSNAFGLADAIQALQVLSKVPFSSGIDIESDVDGDNKIGFAEAIYALQYQAGLRAGVRVSLDPGKSAQKIIASDGGELEITDHDGNVVTLVIPEGAVDGQTEISITLISSITGATLSGGLLTGVDIQPNGLQLLKPAILTIKPIDPGIIAQLLTSGAEYKLTGFCYYGQGSEFHYYPYWIKSDEIHLYLSHFSGYGGGSATEGDQATQYAYTPTDAQAKAQQEASKILGDEAEQLMNDPDYESMSPETQEALTEIHRRWLEESVMPMAKEAEENDQILDCAIIEWMNWEAQGQLQGIIGDDHEPFYSEIQEINTSIKSGLLNAVEKTHQRAVDNKDASQIIRVLNLEAQAQLLGWEDVDVTERLKKMTRFELEFDSTVTELEGLYQISVRTERIILELNEESGLSWLSGQGPLDHVSFRYECMIDYNLQGSTFTADYVLIGVSPYIQPDCNGRYLPKPTDNSAEPNVEMFISPGTPMESVTIQCDEEDEPFSFGGAIWLGSFGYLHNERLDPDFGFFVDAWEMNLGELYARKRFNQSDEYVNETTTLTLWYNPLL